MDKLTPIIKESFEQYAGAVIQSRALVDARDFLKPSARQIFYCMYTDKFIHSKPYKKTLKAIGSAMRLYIHGDSSCEGVLMRAGQPFAMRYPLVDVEGSYGNLIESGNWAAPRYTASRLSEISSYLFDSMEKDTIEEWRDNYDDTEQYPSVLPSKGFYNIVNGTMGISVGLSSSIPQFNLKEVNEALIKLMWNPDIDIDEIICLPDFATGAYLLNKDEVIESLKNGKGKSCKLRSVIDFDPKEKCFIVKEIPYGVYTNTICGQLEKILLSDDNPGIERFNDLTGNTALIKIYLTKNANSNKVIKYLYKNTSLQYFYSINMVMLDKGRFPVEFNWKSALQAHLDHEKEVYIKGYKFDLAKIDKRLSIIEAFLICLEDIENVIQLIKSSKSSKDASVALQTKYVLNEEQAKAILDTKLSRLAHLEVDKIKKEKEDLLKQKEEITAILNDENLLKKEMEKNYQYIANKFGDARRTKILNVEGEDSEIVEKKSLLLNLTNKGFIYVSETSNLFSQRRGSVGAKFKMEESEYNMATFSVNNTDSILLFSDYGNYYQYSVKDLTVGEKIYVGNIIPIEEDEIIKEIVPLNENSKKLVFLTRKGYLKKSVLDEYNTKRKVGVKALELEEDDEVVSILLANDSDKIGILTIKGQFLITELKQVRDVGRVAKGVKGIKLNDGDEVITGKIIPYNTKEIISMTGEGYIKRSLYSEFSCGTRYTKGVRIQKLKDDSDYSSDFLPVVDETEVLIVSTSAQLKLRINEISLLSRDTAGIISIKKKPKDCAIKLIKI